MDQAVRNAVWQRAGGACEYCHLPEECDLLPFQVDHVIARKHRGSNSPDNLALSCYHCNVVLGINLPDRVEHRRLLSDAGALPGR